MLKPKPDMMASSSVLTATEMPDCCSKVSSRVSLGTWPRMELKTKDSICFCGARAVEGVVDLVVEDLVLDADGDLDEDVVAGLGLDLKLGLLDLEVDEVDALGEGERSAQAGAGDAVELAEALDDAGGVGAHGVV
jgi:hypothetical protein